MLRSMAWRHVKVTDRRTRQDFARVLKDLADVHFPGKTIVLVMDNLNTHKLSTLYDTIERTFGAVHASTQLN